MVYVFGGLSIIGLFAGLITTGDERMLYLSLAIYNQISCLGHILIDKLDKLK